MKTKLFIKVFLTAALLLLSCQSGFVQAKNIYVDCTRPDGGDGSSWATAYKYLQNALAAAMSGDNIWVAPGTYKPDHGNGLTPGDRSAAFKLKGGVLIFGGGYGYYYGKTILSGDLNGDDGPNFTNYTDNSYNVLICDNITQHTGISGFTITGGNAEGAYPYSRGGGMLIKSTIGAEVVNCVFSGNMAQHAGGGLYSMNGSNPLVKNCIFSYNKAQNAGGGMQDAGGSSALIHCTFYGNVAVDGPGWGGGLRVYNGNTTMYNCILWGNSAANGNQIEVDTGSTLNISYSDVQGGQAAIYTPDASPITWGAGNIDANPLFEEVAQGNYHLRKGSPCVDTGTKTGAPEYDFEGSPRLSSVGGDDKPDMGADELIVREVGKTGYSYSTIQAAIDAAMTGDLVLVHDGMYVENIDFKGMAIRLRSENGAAGTIIDGNQSGSVVTFDSNEGTESILDGFSIINGNSDFGGGGILCDYSSPTITNCTLTENNAVTGGGIYCNSSFSMLTNCTITGNNATSYGGGIRLQGSSPEINNSIIAGNNSSYGGGIYCHQSSPALTNCTIAQNTTNNNDSGGGLHATYMSHPTVINSILWGDKANGLSNEITFESISSVDVTYSNIQGGWIGQGNRNSVPLFKDAANEDYHLAAGSPCIDTGTSAGAPAYDMDGNTRPIGYGYDMGAYESHAEPAAVLVIKPNGMESWGRNSRQVIRWNAATGLGNLRISLWQNSTQIGIIADNVNPTAGSYVWNVGTYDGGVAPLGTGYTIRVREKGTALSDQSDGPFSIVKISVKTPNGGESWQIGSTQNIMWVTKSISNNLRIVLFKNSVKVGNIVNSIDPALGTYSWTVGNYVGGTAAAGTGYQVQVREIGTDAGDRSDANFTLTAP